jgi:pimeloyl-ACP methyl ester carboxylesterase
LKKLGKTRKLVFLPGLGADPRLFHHQKRTFKGAFTPIWIEPLKRESLARYARRWAECLKLKKGCVLVGISFGGMVALEMAKWVQPKAVLLVGSCRTPRSVPFYLRFLGGFPGWPVVAKLLARIFPRQRGWFLGVEQKDQLDLLMKMFFATPNSFLFWTLEAIRGWAGVETSTCPVHHIHGRKDRLIPCRNVRPDQVIEEGGHTIILTHPKEVNAFIRGIH